MRTVLAAMAGAAVAPAAAQSPHATITAPADQPYAMRHSKLTVPPVLDGMRRVAERQLGDGEVDVYAIYQNATDAITVDAYRNVVGSVPLWFDRACAAIEERINVYGTVTAAGPPAAFTPPGQDVVSGLVGAWTITKSPYRGTALALLPMSGWLVKVRYSSTTLDGPAVAARIPAVLAALSWPNDIAKEAVAAPVASCAPPLAFLNGRRQCATKATPCPPRCSGECRQQRVPAGTHTRLLRPCRGVAIPQPRRSARSIARTAIRTAIYWRSAMPDGRSACSPTDWGRSWRGARAHRAERSPRTT